MKDLKLIKLWVSWGWFQVGIVICLSLVSLPSELPGFHGGDKLMHFAAYCFMMLWFGMCYEQGKAYKGVGVGLAVIGIVLEFFQGMTGYRSFSYSDMAANAIGVIAGGFLAKTRLSMTLAYIEGRARV